MLKMGDNAHYITGNLDIYKEHCGDDLYCKKILLAPKDLKPIYGDFLEKYIFVFFKLKVMISGRPNFNTDLFYNMEYVTYVCVGHGICFFKLMYVLDMVYVFLKTICLIRKEFMG